MNPKIKRELELEQMAINMRDRRVELHVERNGLANTAGGKALVKRVVTSAEASCITALDCWKATESAKRRKSNAFKFLNLLDSDKLTFLTARIAVNGLAKNNVTYRKLVDNTATEVIMATGAELYSKKDENGFKDLVRRLNWQPKVYIRERMAKEEFENACIEVSATSQERLSIGATLIEIFCRESKLFTIDTFWINPKSSKKELNITPLGEQWLKDSFYTNQLASPHHLPMVIQPYPWTTLTDGGYLLQNLHPASFVRQKLTVQPEALQEADLSRAMNAVNAIQETAWAINKPVLEVWRQCVGKGLAGCSTAWDEPIPKRLEESNPDFIQQQAKRREAFEIRKDNNSKICVEVQKRTIADILEHDAEIYFPHNLDFRGRIYPMAGRGAINPQGDDSGKGLLHFAKGKALGEEGVGWLFIHAQNVWGNDKISLDKRISATEENLELYCLFADDPMGNQGWMAADKPFCFLAVCFELLAYKKYGADTLSRIPIALDGSCSGLQHFAGIMKDERTAAAVNVLPTTSGEATDFYSKVANQVIINITGRDCEFATYWLNLITRELVKQPCMTISYGVTKLGMRKQIQEKAKRFARKGQTEYTLGSSNDYAMFLAGEIYDAIDNVVASAFKAMEWLGLAAQVKAKVMPGLSGALSWVAPIGLPVVQEYYEYEKQRLHVFVEGKEIKFWNKTGEAFLLKSKQKQGAAPNFVHSMDASHLMLTVNACVLHGIENFAMIHDSFATYAADTGILFEVLRDEFSKMYQDDVLIQLYMGMPKEVQDQLPYPPARGTLDLSLVQDSEFFFA
jgi:DNA-directed RNA polymerase